MPGDEPATVGSGMCHLLYFRQIFAVSQSPLLTPVHNLAQYELITK